jgi:phage-related tail protein
MAIAAVASVLVALANIPKFADGTNFAPGGLALVGERGPELVNLPRGSQVIPNNQMGSNHVTVTGVIRGKDLALVMSRYNSEVQSIT